MDVIDINCMIGFWTTKRRCLLTADDIYKEMKLYRISNCVAYSSMALWSPNRGNRFIKELASNSSGRIKHCYVLDPNLGSFEMNDEYKLIEHLRHDRPVAVRLYPNMQNYHLDGFYCGELLEILNELAIPVIFDGDQTPGYDMLPSLAKSYPDIKFIILRHGFRESRYVTPLIRKLDNVYFDTSIMVDTGFIEEIVQKYGSEKLLFGSGMPFYSPTGALALILYARIKTEDRYNILYNNWKRIEGGIKWI